MRPPHVKGGFFLLPEYVKPGHNKRQIETDGDVYVLAWDWKFEDNRGRSVRIRFSR
jgi:hypothetical protein